MTGSAECHQITYNILPFTSSKYMVDVIRFHPALFTEYNILFSKIEVFKIQANVILHLFLLDYN